MDSLETRLRRIAEERERLALEESGMREEALAELQRISEEIDALEARKEQLESFLGLDGGGQRAAHGQIQQLCLSVLSRNGGGLTSGQVRETLEAEQPGMKLTSVPATLSRMVATGKLMRDENGRYSAV